MRKVNLFFLLLLASLISLVAFFAVNPYLGTSSPTASQPNWMDDMWRHMGGMSTIQQSQTPSYLWTIPTILAGIALVSAVVLVYFITFPEINTVRHVEENGKDASLPPNSSPSPYTTVFKTMTPEEQKVLEVLSSHGGKYLQKNIRKDAGLSRLKTHRILARLNERGVVTLKKSGNTNEVFLSDWLK